MHLQRARKGDRRDPLLLTNVVWLTVDGNLKHGSVDAVLNAGLDALIGLQRSR